MELLTMEEAKSYKAQSYQRIREACQNKINETDLTRPAYVSLRAGGTIARIVYYVDRVKHYFYGNVVLKDNRDNPEKPTFYVYAQNRLIRIDCEPKKNSSYKVHQFVLMMDYCTYKTGDDALYAYEQHRKRTFNK